MARLIALVIPVLIISAGFSAPFFISGTYSFTLAIMLVGIGGGSLWWIEKKL